MAVSSFIPENDGKRPFNVRLKTVVQIPHIHHGRVWNSLTLVIFWKFIPYNLVNTSPFRCSTTSHLASLDFRRSYPKSRAKSGSESVHGAELLLDRRCVAVCRRHSSIFCRCLWCGMREFNSEKGVNLYTPFEN